MMLLSRVTLRFLQVFRQNIWLLARVNINGLSNRGQLQLSFQVCGQPLFHHTVPLCCLLGTRGGEEQVCAWGWG